MASTQGGEDEQNRGDQGIEQQDSQGVLLYHKGSNTVWSQEIISIELWVEQGTKEIQSGL